MEFAQRFVGEIDFSVYAEAVKQLEACHAFGESADVMGGGEKLTLPPG
jgi:hypothetical protein